MAAFFEVRLVEALSKHKNFAYYIPARFGRKWHDNETDGNPAYAQITNALHAGINKAKELGVGVTIIDCGVFINWMNNPSMGIMAAEKTSPITGSRLENRLPITYVITTIS